MEATETLPRADDAERYVLGCLVAFPERADEVFATQIRALDFVDPLHQRIFQAFADQHVRGAVDPVLVGKQTDPGYLLILGSDITTSVHVPSEATKIVDARRKRQLFEFSESLREAALNGQPADDVFRLHAADLDDYRREREEAKPRDKFSFADLRRQYPRLNAPVVDGLFRAGETVNIISTSKVGKSWLGYSLALSVITGQKWLGRFETTAGKVLLVDNELHRCTLAHRIPAVADALAIQLAEYEHDLEVWSLRGNLRSLADLATDFEDVEPETYQLILLDAKYRFAIEGQNENDNASEARLYNLLDQIADRTKAAIVLVHHTTKGGQSEKRVTDVGAGAGAQSRAADCHLILREHEDECCMVMEAAVRSFAPVSPLPLRWAFPLWIPADDIDPSKLKGRGTRQDERQKENDREGISATLKALLEGPSSARNLRTKTGFGEHRQSRLLDRLEAEKKIIREERKIGGRTFHEYRLPE